MKKLLILILVIAAVGCGGKIVHKAPVPTDRPLYGVTPDGVFFVHESLVVNAQGKDPVFASEVSNFKGRRTQLKNGYYVYDSNTVAHDKKQFEKGVGRQLPPIYLFAIGNGLQIPDALMKSGWIEEKDTVEDKNAGRVFRTEPVENTFLK